MTDPTDTTQNARGIATWLGCVALWVLLGCRTGDPAPESQLTSGLAPSAAQQVASEEPRSLGGGALPFEVDAVVRRVHFAFRSDGAGWRGEHSTHRVAANAEGLAITPRHAPLPGVGATAPASPRAADSTAPIEGTPVHLATRSIARGPRPLGRGVARAELGREGQLVVDRGAGLREIVRNGEHGVEQSWTLESRPEGQGDLEVRVVVEGARLTGVTESGLHFADDASGLGVRYGHGTWIDAHGRRLAVRAAWEQGAVVLRVPAAALDAAAYPAELDPLISPEFGMDNPVMGVASSYQVAPAIAAGGGDYLVVWQDWRSGVDGDIVGARVSSAGVLLDPVGLTISAGPDKQSTPTVAFDGTSWLVAWVDSGAGIDHILGARVSTTGTLLDAAPLVISTATGGQSQPKVSAGAGQWLVVWRDLRNGPTLDIYGARVSSAGTVLDAGGIPICVVAYDQSEPTVAYNGTQWLVTWQDYRVGAYMDLYATRVSGAGVVQDPGGFVVAAAASWQQQPAAASDGSGWLVAWLDSRNGPSQIFCARVGADATVLDPVGTLVASAVWFRGEPEVAFDGTSYLVAWQDDRNGVDYDVFAARVSGGAVLDPGGFLVASAASAQATPAVAFAGSSWLVVWADARSGADWDIYGARVSATGAVLDPAGIPIARASNRQEAPAVSFGGSTWLVVWQDFRGGVDPDIYGVRVDGGGVVLDPSGIAISVAAGRQEAPSVAFDGSQWLVAWSDFRGGATADVYAARVSAAGAVLDPGGLPVSTATNHQQLPAVAFDGANWVVAWEDWRSWATLSRDVYAARVSPSGVVLDPAGIAVTATSAETLAPVIASDGTRTLVVWEDWRTFATTGQDVYGARLTQGGVVLDPAGVAITTGLSSQYGATVAFDGVQWLVAWQDLRAGNWDIYAARVSTAGSVLDPAGVPVSSVGSVAIAPSVAFDGTNTVVVWQDYRNGRSDLYGARLRLDASLVDATGVVLAAAPEDERAPRLARGVGRDVLLGYYRLEPALGSRRVFARRLAFGADAGVACAAASDCETAFCVDGVCCDSACGGAATDDCQACSVATGALADGVCGATTGNACSDADACTQSDACQAGSCVGGNPVVCVASDACHDAGSCDPANGTCSSPPKADGTDCADGDACTQTDTCQAGNCVGGNPVVCVAPDACHDAGSCDPANGTCSSPVKPDGTSCADGDACTQTDICQAGNCVGGNPVVCVAPDACHDAGSCDPANGSCSSPAKPDGTTCGDGSACTQTDTCQAGSCVGGNPVVCVASDACHDAGSCDPANGSCSSPAKPDGTTCSDGSACTLADQCSAGTCVPGSQVTCDDGNGCTSDSCDPAVGCAYANVVDGSACDDGNPCSASDACQAGGCVGGGPVDCDDGDVCTADACDPQTPAGCGHAPLVGASCDEGDLCTVQDTCASDGLGGVLCTPGSALDCDDLEPCTADACDPASGCTHDAVPDGTLCASGVCFGGVCGAGAGGAGGGGSAGGGGAGGDGAGGGAAGAGGQGGHAAGGGGGAAGAGAAGAANGGPGPGNGAGSGCGCALVGSARAGDSSWLAALAWLAGAWGVARRRVTRGSPGASGGVREVRY